MRKSSRPVLIAIAASMVVAIGFILGVDLLARGGGGGGESHPQAVATEAPDDHPAAATSGGPDLHFSTTSVDLGVVPLGQEVAYAFSYANIGAATLKIEDVNVRAVRGC